MKTKVLYIEDNEQNLYLVTFMLESSGYEVIQARDGNEGIALAATVNPEIILLDIQLPALDGYTVAKTIRENHELDNIPIVAVTSYAMVGDKEKALSVGCNGYIEKPINPETFVSQVEEYLKAGKT